ncbi:MAG: hypothetical protein LBV43_04505 [Prevotella sp.]|nr:hypothetical protein [Prevotella sp.]
MSFNYEKEIDTQLAGMWSDKSDNGNSSLTRILLFYVKDMEKNFIPSFSKQCKE